MPADALYDRKVPIYVTAEQLAWIETEVHNRWLRGRSELIRELIDQARSATSPENIEARAEGAAPDIAPYSPATYPGLGMAPVIVPFLIREGRRFYTLADLATACGLEALSIEPGRKAAIGLVMKAAGFHPTRDAGENGQRLEGWKI